MKLVAIINKKNPNGLGGTINALMHLTLGMGHRVQGQPDIAIYVGDDVKVKTFRKIAAQINDGSSLLRDFPLTMTGGDTDKQLQVGRQTAEADMNYFAVCLLAPEVPAELQSLVQSCEQIADYTPFISPQPATLLQARSDYSDQALGKKIVLVINTTIPMAHTLNACILAALEVGFKSPFPELRLLNVMDKEGNSHPDISYHPFPALKSKNSITHKAMVSEAKAVANLFTSTQHRGEEEPLATVAFGDREAVEAVFNRERTELLRIKFPALVAAKTAAMPGASKPAAAAESNDAQEPTKATNIPAAAAGKCHGMFVEKNEVKDKEQITDESSLVP